MNEKLIRLSKFSIVSSVRSTISQGKVNYYTISIKGPSNAITYEKLECLWPYSVIAVIEGVVVAEYMVRPQELDDFYEAVSNLTLPVEADDLIIISLHFDDNYPNSPKKQLLEMQAGNKGNGANGHSSTLAIENNQENRRVLKALFSGKYSKVKQLA